MAIDLDGNDSGDDKKYEEQGNFDVIINVMNKSYDSSNEALNVNLELTSDCDAIIITSSTLGDIGNISAGDTYEVHANIAISETVVIDDYFLNLEKDIKIKDFVRIKYNEKILDLSNVRINLNSNK